MTTTTTTTPFFAPTYFSPYYFPPLVSTVGDPTDPPIPATPYGDRDAFAAILARLEGTKAFASVLFGAELDRRAIGASTPPMVSLIPGAWEEADEVDPPCLVRRVGFRLVLLVRDDDPLARYEQLARLERAARQAIDGNDLGGCLPSLTRIRSGAYDDSPLHPEGAARLDGEFSYLIDPVPAA